MTPLRDATLVCVAIVALAIGAFTAGWWMGRAHGTETALEARIVALEARQAPQRAAAAPSPPARAAAPPAADPIEVPVDGAPFRGPEDAPVTVVAFSDFQCPFCARVNPALEQLRETYRDQVRIVFKHFPLPIHPQAELAHRASVAAAEHGRFWEMHDRIFANPRAVDRETLRGHAAALGLDVAAFEAALDSDAVAERVRNDLSDGSEAGVRGTPTFVINGRLLTGAQPYAAFKSHVDRALAEAGLAVETRG